MGLQIFSMEAGAIPEIKQIIRQSDTKQALPYIDRIMVCSDSAKRADLLQELNNKTVSDRLLN